jgi:ribosome-associated translation inhibitor RaiA
MIINCTAGDGLEISTRFKQSVEDRIARLERDAARDEAMAATLEDGDHIRRQMRLVAAQRAEALRMRLFLDKARIRLPRPLIEL